MITFQMFPFLKRNSFEGRHMAKKNRQVVYLFPFLKRNSFEGRRQEVNIVMSKVVSIPQAEFIRRKRKT